MNKIILFAKVFKKQPLAQTGQGTSLINFTLTDSYKKGDEFKKNYYNCSAFGKTAEALDQYISEGQFIHAFGSIQQSQTFEPGTGKKNNWTNYVIDRIEFPDKFINEAALKEHKEFLAKWNNNPQGDAAPQTGSKTAPKSSDPGEPYNLEW